jgi:V/A-type H+-transporting ATPase subunit I
LLVIPLALVPIGEIFVDKKPLAVGLYSVMEVGQTFLVNTISYVRIVIIAVVHGALLLMVLSIMDLMTSGLSGAAGTALAAVIFIGGNVVVFGMEAMIALVQTIRLHYYEFFSKFYRGSGRNFAPFRAERNYTVRRS